jgi:hypothetical protein
MRRPLYRNLLRASLCRLHASGAYSVTTQDPAWTFAGNGRSGGVRIEITTQGGGKKFHGDVFEFLRNEP